MLRPGLSLLSRGTVVVPNYGNQVPGPVGLKHMCREVQGPSGKVTGGIAVPTASKWDQVPGTKWEGDQVP